MAGVIFNNLTSKPTSVHIHGPAGPGANAPVVATLRIVSAQLVNGKWNGEAFAIFNATAQQIMDLRTQSWYMDVHTVGHLNGEIRGSLTPLQLPFAALNRPDPFRWLSPSDVGWTSVDELLRSQICPQCYSALSANITRGDAYERRLYC